MLFAVVLLTMVPIVVPFMLLLALLLLILLGMLVLSIISTHYATIHGGSSIDGVYCGAFYINARNGFSVLSWAFGAALS